MWEYLAGNMSHTSVGPGDQRSRKYFFFGCNSEPPSRDKLGNHCPGSHAGSWAHSGVPPWPGVRQLPKQMKHKTGNTWINLIQQHCRQTQSVLGTSNRECDPIPPKGRIVIFHFLANHSTVQSLGGPAGHVAHIHAPPGSTMKATVILEAWQYWRLN